MTPRGSGRSQSCTPADAAIRLRHAQRFLEVSELVAGEGDDPEYASVSAALAVLAGIAASDAACCAALGRRWRGQDHRGAMTLLGQVSPNGRKAAQALGRLLSLKDEAQYGLFDVGAGDLKAALRQARELTGFAEQTVRR